MRRILFASLAALLVCNLALAAETELAGGDYENGRSLFFGERLKCAACHRIRGDGATIGPDLSKLAHRDASSVLRELKEPSLTKSPGYAAYHSLKPEKLLEGLKADQIRDLLTFLTTEPPHRTGADLQQVLLRSSVAGNVNVVGSHALNIVLVASKQDHGPGQHDYPAWQKKWLALLQWGTNLAVNEAWEWPSPAQFRTADVIVFYFWNHQWTDQRYADLEGFLKRGGGVALFHAAVIADKEPEKLAAHIGLAAQPGPTQYRHTPFVLKFTAPTNHPITTGFADLPLLDEPYWPMIGDPKNVKVLATAEIDGAARPMIWVLQKGLGRVFASIVGHYTWTFDDPLFRLLALRGISWAGGQSPGRLEEFADK
jgi:type 1 glutamine amidotransferase/cytochrome c553